MENIFSHFGFSRKLYLCILFYNDSNAPFKSYPKNKILGDFELNFFFPFVSKRCFIDLKCLYIRLYKYTFKMFPLDTQ